MNEASYILLTTLYMTLDFRQVNVEVIAAPCWIVTGLQAFIELHMSIFFSNIISIGME
jgi:hypothetical protein